MKPKQQTAMGASGGAGVAPQDVENPGYEEPEVPQPELSAYTGYIHFRGPNNVKSELLGFQPFLLYWCMRGGSDFYPVGLWDNRDFSPKVEVSKNDILQIRFATKSGQPLKASDLSSNSGPPSHPAIPMEWRRGTGSWMRPSQRKGQDYYIAVVNPDNNSSAWPMHGVRTCHAYDDGIRFGLWMDIGGKGDAWISDEDNTGSIRMQTPEARRAYLVAIRHGTGDDPFGSQTVFRKRAWSDLIG
ncbi:hypothetical protein [Nocardia sp. NPDC046763]|uniref:hypothetical protein n=1 Tax=Nocardia sp. NPDC046763 TaxID=3155256 RepID=UPI0033D56CD4